MKSEPSHLTDEKKQKERRFFDRIHLSSLRRWLDGFYAITESSRHYFESRLLECAEGKRVLEIGCGDGTYSLWLASHGADVEGIDLSGENVATARSKASQIGIGSASFQVMDAEHLAFPDASFDIVFGSSVLHHLDIEPALAGIGRVLKPNGEIFFYEPLGYNPVINLFRMLTPRMRTASEKPLRTRQLRIVSKSFTASEFRYFHLATLLALPLARWRGIRRLLPCLDAVDRLMFRWVPPLGKLGWIVFLHATHPLPISAVPRDDSSLT